MDQCINFDFGLHWSRIIPYLQTPEIKQMIPIVFWEIVENNPQWISPSFQEDEAPASLFNSNDGYVTMCDTMLEAFVDNADERIPTELLQEYRHHKASFPKEDDEDQDAEVEWMDDLGDLEVKMRDYVGLNYVKDPTSLVHWCAFNSCHWINPHIMLYWAKLVCPDVQWKVLRAELHTTIISADGKQMFDLLAWGWNHKRFEAYNCKLPYVETDPTLGANEALAMIANHSKMGMRTLLKRINK